MSERIISRFDKYMIYKKLNDNKVTVQLNLSNGLLGKARLEDHDLGKRTIEKILNFYTDLDRTWFITGHGEMLKSEYNPAKMVSTKGPVSNLKSLIGDSPPSDQNTIWTTLMKLVESNTQLIQSNQALVEAQTMLAQAHKILAETNAKLTNQVEEMKEATLPGPAGREEQRAG